MNEQAMKGRGVNVSSPTDVSPRDIKTNGGAKTEGKKAVNK